MRTTVGRILFNRILPDQMRFANEPMRRVDLKRLVDTCYRLLGPAETAHLVDGIKDVGFKFATRGGLTIGLWDIVVPKAKTEKLVEADEAVASIDKQFQRGLITEDERYEQVVELWQRVTKDVSDRMMESLGDENPVRMMTDSGARGNKGNIGQLGAMRGLMADPSGRIIDVPVRSNFREGMTVLEYFISTHGARKGLADTALRTADSGYLTRRLVDVAQDVITREDDCGTEEGSWIIRAESADEPEAFQRRLVGRLAAADLVDPKAKVKKGETAPIVVARGDMISEELAKTIDAAGIDEVLVRSPLACESRYGVCRMCYGRNLATGEMIGIGEAVGIIAAQSIGEPGTQLTMRTFHTGGVAGQDITQGLPRVEELFEARIPKGKAEISHIDGIVEVIAGDTGRKVKVTSREALRHARSSIEDGAELLAAAGDLVELNQVHRPRRRAATRRRPSRASSPRPTTASSSVPRTSWSASTRSRTARSCWSRTARRSAPATRSPTARSTRRSTSTPGARTPSSATWSRRSSGSTGARASRSTTSTSRSSSARCSRRSGSTSRATASSCRRSSSTASTSRRRTTASSPRAASRRRRRPCSSA